ncbi:MAG: acetyl-CoA carboxylase biotin carboxylase subunit [Chloroflexi bacterium]|nr:acetyl-CoA carboxylase biotin carboxylase subunit [Chloroflexota bacterium]
MPFRRILIANRGEIAIRISRACRELGIRSIAVFSEADRGALHTRLADEAVPIGPAPARESYLSIERVVDAVRRSGADAIHPGYGFLSENADFAAACEQAGLTFIGPSPAAMRLVGDKAAARQLAAAHGVPVVPGYDGPAQDDATLTARAAEIGYPLLVKAVAGGGGRGIRVVTEPDMLAEALTGARREALAAFGDGALLLERYVTSARHVEVQVLGDRHGAILYLGERDCSVQRRHQKVIEECPSPAVTPELRAALGAAAVTVTGAAGYWNAGTCEFLLDETGRFSFIEMNARLQVEHPVTELVTGVDLVRRQIEVAAGLPLDIRQEDVQLRGHAVECRLYAEDPFHDFVPSSGRLTRLRPPLGVGLRHDVGYAEGDTVTTFYDSMLAKLIAYGEDRATAIARACDALQRYEVAGVATNRALLVWILEQTIFRAGETTTQFLEQAWQPAEAARPPAAFVAAAAAIEAAQPVTTIRPGQPSDPWAALGAWRISGQGVRRWYRDGDSLIPAVVDADGPGWWRVMVGEEWFRVGVPAEEPSAHVETLDGSRAAADIRVDRRGDGLLVSTADASHVVAWAGPPNPEAALAGVAGGSGADTLVAPMPGRVVRVAVREGDQVRAHQTVAIVEAMKIEHSITAPHDGFVAAVRCQEGEAVDGGQVLVELGDERHSKRA